MAKKTQSACELVASAAGSNIYTLTYILSIRDRTNVIRGTYIRFYILSIGGKLATRGRYNYNIYQLLFSVARVG